jgi:uncharacterized LabA/DUF88 family protein
MAVCSANGCIPINVDAELVLHAAAIQYPDYDKTVIVTNDGDFLCLVQYLKGNDKPNKILAPNTRYSTLYRPCRNIITTMDRLRGKLELTK